ncbi:toxin biosynthesis protein Tri7-like protein [Aspergillus costaricaensis CBS 115574]|uniref:Toxin biosynthesis protein Tri7-like protein n=1 Tax=Aspergillus costaricaensis CBS 115574 TaxID=1448317 RepID=A0ACD1IAN2_9EURO|nr:toxin biosynthesis protein Tri7-like protein [Aspergillus costaricaensis CBS 115574]RAK87580.1 toxin biosynthesis protein Tri7-like protein [Aspergillus costaricaensis CBS 115574]
MAISPDLLCTIVTILQSFVTVTLIARTPRNSFLRWICLPSIIYMAYIEGVLIKMTDHHTYAKVTLSGMPFTVLIQHINLLLIVRVDLTGQLGTIAGKFASAFALLQSTRGIGTPWQVKNIPSHPLVLRAKPPSRGYFMSRQLAIAIWEVLALVLVLSSLATHDVQDYDGSYLYGSGREFEMASSSMKQLLGRVTVAFLFGLPGSMLFLDSMYRVASLISVATVMTTIASWPPEFGSLADTYTVRGFWGKFWHQNLRWSYTGVSTAITCRILGLPKPSLIERYLNLTIVFILSGLMHVFTNVISGIEGGNTGAMLFFVAQAGAIMFEDAVQHYWAILSRGKKGTSAETSIWQRCVGFVWVFCWLGATFPWWWYPIIRMLVAYNWTGVLEVVQGLGMTKSNLSVVVTVGAVILRIVFGAEI